MSGRVQLANHIFPLSWLVLSAYWSPGYASAACSHTCAARIVSRTRKQNSWNSHGLPHRFTTSKVLARMDADHVEKSMYAAYCALQVQV